MMISNGYTEPACPSLVLGKLVLTLSRDITNKRASTCTQGDGETQYSRGRTDSEALGLSAPLLETDVPVARTAGAHGGTGPAEQSLQDLQDSEQTQDIPEEFQ